MSSTGAEIEEQGSPLYPLLNQINAAAVGGLHLLAVAMAVALPDICVSLISSNGRTSPAQYKKWCAENLGLEFSFVTPDDLYSMRCGVLHNGRFGDMKHNVARVIFALPNIPGIIQNGLLNDAYFYSVIEFCRNFTLAAYRWCEANKNNETLKANMPRLMQYRPGGIAPYIGGVTVLA